MLNIITIFSLFLIVPMAFRDVKKALILWILLTPFFPEILFKVGISFTFDRIAIFAIIVGIIVKGRWNQFAIDSRNPVEKWMFVFVASLVVGSTLFFVRDGSPTQKLLGILDAYVIPMSVALIIRMIINEEKDKEVFLEKILYSILFVGLLSAIISIYEGITLHDLLSVHSAFSEAHGGGLRASTGGARTNGPFAQPEALGILLASCIFIQLALRNQASVMSFSLKQKIAICRVSQFIIVTGLWFNMFRSFWLGAIVGVMMRPLFVPKERGRYLFLGLFLICISLVSFESFSRTSVYQSRISDIDTIYSRIGAYKYALRAFAENPIFGVGWKRLDSYIDTAIETGDILYTNHVFPALSAHNVYLLILSEAGLIGFIPLVLFIKSILISAYRNSKINRFSLEKFETRMCLISIFVAYFVPMFFDKLVYAKVNNYLFVFVGLLIAQVNIEKKIQY